MAASVPELPDTDTIPIRRVINPEALAALPDDQVLSVPCPKCGSKLVNPGSLGWCMKCGYCKSLQDESSRVMPSSKPVQKPSTLGMSEFFDTLSHVPDWVYHLLVGCLVILAISIGANAFLPPDSMQRAVWSTGVVAGGILVTFFVQIWLMVVLAPKDEENRLSPWQLLQIFPARLWKYAFRHLPGTCKQVNLGVWSWLAINLSVFMVGGIDYWFQYYQPKKIASRGLRDAVALAEAAADGKNKSLEEAIDDFAGKGKDLTKDKKKDDKIDKRATVECVILGYTMDEDSGDLTGLILASIRDEQLSYVGTVKRGFTSQASEEMKTRFAKLIRPTPFIRSLKIPDAIWLKPEVYCEVHQSGWDIDGLLLQPNFKALLDGRK